MNGGNGLIDIQQDNVRAHIIDGGSEWRETVGRSGMKVKLIHLPPNSPDLNVLDIGYFNSIQALQQSTRSDDIDKLVDNVEQSFENLEGRKLENVFLSLQRVME